jgi:hypothetical protein
VIERLLLTAALFLALPAPSNAPRTFDLSSAFEFTQTSASLRQYGYSATSSLAPDQFRLDSYLDKLVPICFWHPTSNDRSGPGYYPYVAYNGTNKSQTEPTRGWVARAGQVAMEASNTGQYSLVRFVVPVGGVYRIRAHFEGIHFRLSSTDVHVLHNSVHLFDSDIQGYGGDSAFHPVEGLHPAVSYEVIVKLARKDTVTFAVGYGQNRTNYNDTTGLFAHLVLLASSDPLQP